MKSLNFSLFIFLIFILSFLASVSGCFTIPEDCYNTYSKWREDPLGCRNFRSFLLENGNLKYLEDCLVGESPGEIVDILGEPNRLTKKETETLYVYYILPGGQCFEDHYEVSDSPRLIISVTNQIQSVDIVYP